jgi:uroporphyrinogen-III synthase
VRGTGGVDLPRLLNEGKVDVVTFTSSSTVEYCLERLHDEGNDQPVVLDDLCIACIGPKTADTAVASGLKVDVVPDGYTLEGLLDAIEQHYLLLRNGTRHAISGKANHTD